MNDGNIGVKIHTWIWVSKIFVNAVLQFRQKWYILHVHDTKHDIMIKTPTHQDILLVLILKMFTKLEVILIGLVFTYSGTVFTSAIAFERYLGVFWPLRYKQWLTTARIRLIFFLCLAYPFTFVAALSAKVFIYEAYLPCSYFIVFPTWVVAIISGQIFFNILIMIVIYLLIIKITIRLQKQVRHILRIH